ncbi:hypothetical protein CRV153 [Nile crocodilepox virus]|uniref:Uncharacterized protein n=1 Tax=Nile crocodilepox virus (isolate Crocodylus niloticus/Zimbabwe/Ume/2001) TaxID=1289473 RepID=Q06ZZ8_CPRVZ|nr:hypothetical protein CRV153 [Nile crocodilepox virus]ABJ09044.1 hypothetical protein CRV153 [Nile crocodilepox virus]
MEVLRRLRASGSIAPEDALALVRWLNPSITLAEVKRQLNNATAISREQIERYRITLTPDDVEAFLALAGVDVLSTVSPKDFETVLDIPVPRENLRVVFGDRDSMPTADFAKALLSLLSS